MSHTTSEKKETFTKGDLTQDDIPGEQCGAFRFKVFDVLFHGILEDAKEEYKRLNPSDKWFIWLQNTYNIIKNTDASHATDAFMYAALKCEDFGIYKYRDQPNCKTAYNCVNMAIVSKVCQRMNNVTEHFKESNDELVEALTRCKDYLHTKYPKESDLFNEITAALNKANP